MSRGIADEAMVAVTVGVLLGAVTRVADNQENALTWLGSLLAPWVLAAFAVGARSARWQSAVVLSTATMVIGVVVYYAWWYLFDDGARLVSLLEFWLLFAPVAGVTFGLAGWVWRVRVYHWLLPVTSVALSGGFVAGESVFFMMTSRTFSAAELALISTVMTLGLMKPLILLGGTRDRLAGLALTVCFLAVGAMSIPVIRWLAEIIR